MSFNRFFMSKPKSLDDARLLFEAGKLLRDLQGRTLPASPSTQPSDVISDAQKDLVVYVDGDDLYVSVLKGYGMKEEAIELRTLYIKLRNIAYPSGKTEPL